MTAFGTPTTKLAQRAAALARRAALSPEERAAASDEIAWHTLTLITTIQPGVVAGYIAIRDEADPSAILDDLRASNLPVALPATSGETLVFRAWPKNAPLVPGPFGLSEPAPDAPELVPDLLIIPIAAFDRAGNRLGYGRGYYDRAVTALRRQGNRPILVGVAFAAQEVASVITEPHDVKLDYVVTEEGALLPGTP